MKVLHHDFNTPLDHYGVAVRPGEEKPEVGEVVKVRDHSEEFQVECRILEYRAGTADDWWFAYVERLDKIEYL